MWTPAINAFIIISCVLQGLEVFAHSIKPISKTHPDSSDVPLKRNARVWTDENFACILRHCKQHPAGSSNYLSCLNENCRRGMMAVQRDIEYPYYEDYADDPSMITADFIGSGRPGYIQTTDDHIKDSSIDYLGGCFERLCQGLPMKMSLSCLVDHCIEADSQTNQIEKRGRFESYHTSDAMSSKLRSMLELMYGDRLGDKTEIGDAEITEIPSDTITEFDQLPLANVNKRRVNDEVSQCIQSYCGNEIEKLTCILKHCHRARSIYKKRK